MEKNYKNSRLQYIVIKKTNLFNKLFYKCYLFLGRKMEFNNDEDMLSSKKQKKMKIRINKSKSPLNLVKNKFKDKQEKPVNIEETLDNLEQVMQRVQNIIDQDEREEKRDRLLKMIYTEDISAKNVQNTIGITEVELESIVDELLELGFLKFIDENELELTNDAILYLKNQEPFV